MHWTSLHLLPGGDKGSQTHCTNGQEQRPSSPIAARRANRQVRRSESYGTRSAASTCRPGKTERQMGWTGLAIGCDSSLFRAPSVIFSSCAALLLLPWPLCSRRRMEQVSHVASRTIGDGVHAQ